MNKRVIITIILVLIASLFAAAACYFMVSKIYGRRETVLSLRKNLLINEKKTADIESLRRLASDIKLQKEKIESMFIKEKDMIRLIESLESISAVATGTSVKINSISPQAKGIKPTLSFSAVGSFEQVFNYLHFLENMPYLIIIDKSSFQRVEKSEKNKETKWQAVFDVQLEGYENS